MPPKVSTTVMTRCARQNLISNYKLIDFLLHLNLRWSTLLLAFNSLGSGGVQFMGAYIKELIPRTSQETWDCLDSHWLPLWHYLRPRLFHEFSNRLHGGRHHAKGHTKNAQALSTHKGVLFRRRVRPPARHCVYFHPAWARDTYEPPYKIPSVLAFSWPHRKSDKLSEPIQTSVLDAVYSRHNPLERLHIFYSVTKDRIWIGLLGLPRHKRRRWELNRVTHVSD